MSDPLLPDEPWPQRVSRVLAWIAGAIILVGCGGLISIDVVTRAVLRRGVVESFEISGYALAAAIGLGLAFAATQKANIRVDILLDLAPPPLRRACDLVAALSLAIVAGALAFWCWGTLAQSYAMGARSISSLQTPMALPQSVWWGGIAWFAAIAILLPIQAALRLVRGDTAGFDAAVGSLRVTDEIRQAGVARDEAASLADARP